MTQPAKVINRGLYYMLYLIQNRWALIANHDGENKSLDEMLNSKKSLLQNNNYKQNSYWVARTMYIHIKGKAETIVGPEMQNVRALIQIDQSSSYKLTSIQNPQQLLVLHIWYQYMYTHY